MEILRADTADFTGIRAIWEEHFTTDSNYLSIMFGEIMPLCTSYVCKENGRIISVLSLMPMIFANDETAERLNGWYMFGVATIKKYWGKRVAAHLIDHTTNTLQEQGYSFIFERPATQALNNYYRNLGFTKQLEYIPHTFKTQNPESSTGNIIAEFTELGTETQESINRKANTVSEVVSGDIFAATLAENILKEIRTAHPKRFEWENIHILHPLIKIGELDFHNITYCKTPPQGVFISIKTLNQTPEELFNNTFFCFPME